MKKKWCFLFITIFLFLIYTSISVYAHPGGTDSNGGHTNHSTGEYHYHHGYKAHQHTDGICPYDFDDKTDQNSTTSESSTAYKGSTAEVNYNSQNRKAYNGPTLTSLYNESKFNESKKEETPNGEKTSGFYLLLAIPICLIIFPICSFLIDIIKKRKRKEIAKYSIQQLETTEKVTYVYITKKGKCYHRYPNCKCIKSSATAIDLEYVKYRCSPCSICCKYWRIS